MNKIANIISIICIVVILSVILANISAEKLPANFHKGFHEELAVSLEVERPDIFADRLISKLTIFDVLILMGPYTPNYLENKIISVYLSHILIMNIIGGET